MAKPLIFAATAPAKVNLHLGVGEKQADGYHDLVTVFQAVDRRETVRLIVDPDAPCTGPGSLVTGITTRWSFDEPLPETIDTPGNLAWKAVDLAVDAWRSHHSTSPQPLPAVHIEVDKTIFIAGGMAGGSADAAAALVAAHDFIRHHASSPGPRPDIAALAPQLGADVPFALAGGNALGRGRGDALDPADTRHRFWWVFVNPATTLSTATCFATLDSLRGDNPELEPNLDATPVTEALNQGDPHLIAAALHNDLELPARLLRPQIGDVIDHGNGHALRAIVSGSGPTVAMLCENEAHAHHVLESIRHAFPGYQAFACSGPAEGAQHI